MTNREEAETQISELDLLSSMFPYEEEFTVTDQLAVAELKHFVENEAAEVPSSKIQFILNVKLEDPNASMVFVCVCVCFVLGRVFCYFMAFFFLNVTCAHLFLGKIFYGLCFTV